MNDVAILASRDPLALQMLKDYSRACATFAHTPTQDNANAVEFCGAAFEQRVNEQAGTLSAAIDALVIASQRCGRYAYQADVVAADWADAQEARTRAEFHLRGLLGL